MTLRPVKKKPEVEEIKEEVIKPQPPKTEIQEEEENLTLEEIKDLLKGQVERLYRFIDLL